MSSIILCLIGRLEYDDNNGGLISVESRRRFLNIISNMNYFLVKILEFSVIILN